MNKRPKDCCYPDCLHCPYPDCCYDELEYYDIVEQDKFDKELEVVEPEVLRMRKSQQKYFKSDKGKQALKRYAQSEKGKEAFKRKNKKNIESGKNAEYCRRYYQRKKARILELNAE